jgi:GTP cyclohydrolase I
MYFGVKPSRLGGSNISSGNDNNRRSQWTKKYTENDINDILQKINENKFKNSNETTSSSKCKKYSGIKQGNNQHNNDKKVEEDKEESNKIKRLERIEKKIERQTNKTTEEKLS